MFKTAFGLWILVTSAGAAAEPVLWQDIEAGMLREKVEALYPPGKKVKHGKSSTTLKNVAVGECEGDVTIKYQAGAVAKVEIFGGGCASRTFAAMVGKYGEPMADESTTDDPDELFEDKTRRAVWRADGRVIRYRGTTNGISSWWRLIYEPIRDTGL